MYRKLASRPEICQQGRSFSSLPGPTSSAPAGSTDHFFPRLKHAMGPSLDFVEALLGDFRPEIPPVLEAVVNDDMWWAFLL